MDRRSDFRVEANIFKAVVLRQQTGLRWQSSVRSNESWVHRYELASILKGHHGCVNTIHWSPDAQLLCSGSDDRHVKLWRFGHRSTDGIHSPLSSHLTLHSHNVFDAQLTRCQQRIVSCGADGCVALTQVESSVLQRRLLYEPDAGHCLAMKIAFAPRLGPDAFLVTFGDGRARSFDLREREHRIAVETGRGAEGALTGIAMHPLNDALLAIGGSDPFLRLYDLRKMTLLQEEQSWSASRATPVVSLHAARDVLERTSSRRRSRGFSDVGISGVAWSPDGSLLLANYRQGDVVLFDMSMPMSQSGEGDQGAPPAYETVDKPEVRDAFHLPDSRVQLNALRSFVGRANEETCCKEVRFMCGSRVVATGGDCGHFFLWETATGELLRKLPADRCVVNCVAPHPTMPLVCTSGIDSEIKVWDVGDGRVRNGKAQKGSSEEAPVSGDWGRRRREGAPSATVPEAEQRLREADQRKQRGNDLIKQGRWSDALDQYQEALRQLHFLPPNVEAQREREALAVSCHLNCAFCHLNLEEYAPVVEACTQVLELDGGSIKARFRRAKALGELRDYDQAFKDIEAALVLEPDNADLLSLRTKLRKQQKHRQKREQEAYQRLFTASDGT